MLIYRNAEGVHSQKDCQPLLYKLGILVNFGQMHGLLSCEVFFFLYCVIKRIADHAPRPRAYARGVFGVKPLLELDILQIHYYLRKGD